jgi:cell surface protein SprA
MSESTTSILDLPTDPVSGGNISMKASENQVIAQGQIPTNPTQGSVSLDQTTISQIVSGLQQAAVSGATQLPSRDIPMNTSGHSNDAQVQPNYVPMHERQADYIKDYEYFGCYDIDTIFGDFQKLRVNFKTFQNYRTTISQRLGTNIDAKGYAFGYGRYAQDVLIPAFIAAYTGQDPKKVSLINQNTTFVICLQIIRSISL